MSSGAPTSRVLPDGCVDLIWSGGSPAVLGVPADELRDRRLPLESVWPAAAARRAIDLIARAEHPGRALEDLALARLAERPPDPVARAVAARLVRGVPVAAVAAEVALSERQLRRRCVTAFGYGPKTLARILRLGRALSLAGYGTGGGAALARLGGGAALAAAAGYADQAHLAREVKALAGVPLGELLAG